MFLCVCVRLAELRLQQSEICKLSNFSTMASAEVLSTSLSRLSVKTTPEIEQHMHYTTHTPLISY